MWTIDEVVRYLKALIAKQGPRGGKLAVNDQTGKVVARGKRAEELLQAQARRQGSKPGQAKREVRQQLGEGARYAMPLPKDQRQPVEQTATKIRELSEQPESLETRKAIERLIVGHTVKEIAELKKALGLKASGAKSLMASRLARRAFERMGKPAAGGVAAEIREAVGGVGEKQPLQSQDADARSHIAYEKLFSGKPPKLEKYERVFSPFYTLTGWKVPGTHFVLQNKGQGEWAIVHENTGMSTGIALGKDQAALIAAKIQSLGEWNTDDVKNLDQSLKSIMSSVVRNLKSRNWELVVEALESGGKSDVVGVNDFDPAKLVPIAADNIQKLRRQDVERLIVTAGENAQQMGEYIIKNRPDLSDEVEDLLSELGNTQSPREGDRNADGLVFRDGRWHREEQPDIPDRYRKNYDRVTEAVSKADDNPIPQSVRSAIDAGLSSSDPEVRRATEVMLGRMPAGQGHEWNKRAVEQMALLHVDALRTGNDKLAQHFESVLRGVPGVSKIGDTGLVTDHDIERHTTDEKIIPTGKVKVVKPGWVLQDGDNPRFIAAKAVVQDVAGQSPREGERNADGLVFRDGRWHREEAEAVGQDVAGQIREAAASVPQNPPSVTTPSKSTGTSKLFRDVKVGSVIMKNGKRHGVVTSIDDGILTVRLDRATRLENDDDDWTGNRRREYTRTELITRLGNDPDAPLQPTYSVQVGDTPAQTQSQQQATPLRPASQPAKKYPLVGKATDKQVSFALSLLRKAGYSTRFMNKEFKELGASMRERSGSVQSWLEGMSKAEISALIDKLK